MHPDIPLHVQAGNIDVIKDMREWMNAGKTGVELSTVSKTIGHLFSYHDSMLAFETKKNLEFTLANYFLFSPQDCEKLNIVNDPRPWFYSYDGLNAANVR